MSRNETTFWPIYIWILGVGGGNLHWHVIVRVHHFSVSLMSVNVRKKVKIIQESTHSCTKPDPGHHMGNWQRHNKTSRTREPRSQSFPQQVTTRLQVIDKTVWQRQTRNKNNIKDPQKKHRLETVSKKITVMFQEHIGGGRT